MIAIALGWGCPLEWAPMRRTFLLVAILLACTLSTAAPKKHTYLFAWCGDIESKASDFLAVIDADPASPQYGKVLESLPTGVAGSVPHHTEVEMPAGGLLMANGFEAGRTWIFDLREPLKPRIVTSFGSLGGYMHPHTFVRLPNGNVLATFQYHGGHGPKDDGGGLLEVNNSGQMLRSGSATDPAAAGELIRPYSVELLPGIDRVALSLPTPPCTKRRTAKLRISRRQLRSAIARRALVACHRAGDAQLDSARYRRSRAPS